jgi:nucleoid DNA-binding protein
MAGRSISMKDLCEAIEAKVGTKRNLVKGVLGALTEVAVEEIQNGHKFTVPGVATVEPKARKALPKRKVRNPATGEESMAPPRPASIVVKARPVAAIKKAAPSIHSKAGKALKAAAK